jgi:ACT domain-containing protein
MNQTIKIKVNKEANITNIIKQIRQIEGIQNIKFKYNGN